MSDLRETAQKALTALRLAYGALLRCSPCAAEGCQADQSEWLRDAAAAAESAMLALVSVLAEPAAEADARMYLRDCVDAVMRYQWSNSRKAMDALTQLIDAAYAAGAQPDVSSLPAAEAQPMVWYANPDAVLRAIYSKSVTPIDDSDRTFNLGINAACSAARIALLSRPPRSTPPRLTEDEIEDQIDKANAGFVHHRNSARGQQVTPFDDWKHWFARAIESAVRRQFGDSGSNAADQPPA